MNARRNLLTFFTLLAGLVGSFGTPAQAQQTQCVTNAIAGGTVDNITVPLLPCALNTNILILTAAGANTIAQPTLQMPGYPRQNIYTSAGAAPGVGAITGAGATILLTSTGSSWKIVSGNASTVFSGVLTVPNGGTGVATIPTNRLMVGQGTGAITTVSAGTTGQYLIGNTGSPPSWGTISSSLVSSFSAGTTGFTPSGATTGAVTLAGTLIPANGGTGIASYTVGDLLYSSASATLAKLAGVATGNVLLSGGVSTAPAWGKVDLTAAVTGTLPVANGGTGATSLTANGLLYGNTTSAVGVISPGTTGQLLVGVTGSVPVWTSTPSSGVTSISFGTTGLTPSSATGGVVTVAGTVIAANGGTGFASYAVGDLLYANTTTTLAKLADVATGQVLVSGGVGVAPGYTGALSLSTSLAIAGGTAMTANAGNGTQIVHSTGSQTSGRCVEIDGNGNHIAAGVACINGGLNAVTSQTGNFNASSNTMYCVDTTGGAITATLPAGPTNSDIILFIPCSAYSANNLVISRNGNNIQGLAENMTVATNNAAFHLIFVTSYGWRMY